MKNSSTDLPEIEIVEQPIARGYRFRYKCEGKTAGTVPGQNTTNKRKTVPAIRINNVPPDCGVIVVISCVTAEEPHRPHPHQLVGKDCDKGICTLKLKKTNTLSLQGIGIQCVKKTSILESLAQREELRVDPFQGGFYEDDYNYDARRVCFAIQAFLDVDNCPQPIPPVVTNIIHDCKADSNLSICKMDKMTCSAKGGEEVFLLCEKVSKDDIAVQFYEEDQHTGNMKWESLASFSPNDVHKQFAIVFTTPPYKDQNISSNKEVCVRLYRPSDQSTSDPKRFVYTKIDPDPYHLAENTKKRKLSLFPQSIESSQMPTVVKNAATSMAARPKTAFARPANISAAASATCSSPASSAVKSFPVNNYNSCDNSLPGTPLLDQLIPDTRRIIQEQPASNTAIPAVVNQFDDSEPSTSFVPSMVPQQPRSTPLAQATDESTTAITVSSDDDVTAQYLLGSMSLPHDVTMDDNHLNLPEYLMLSDFMAEANFAAITLEELEHIPEDDHPNRFADLSKLQTDNGTFIKKILMPQAKLSDVQSVKHKKNKKSVE